MVAASHVRPIVVSAHGLLADEWWRIRLPVNSKDVGLRQSRERKLSSQVQSQVWGAGPGASVRQQLLNFFARRRIAISLIGFTGLSLGNVLIRKTVPHNPFAWGEPAVTMALALLATGLVIRSWAAGTLNKSRELTTHGPYALSRNPLYIGSFLMMFAFCMMCRDWPTLAFVAGPMMFLYWLQVRFEEQRLERLFPEEWHRYKVSTPRFIPHRVTRTAFSGWTTAEWCRNREYRTLAASAIGVMAVYLWHIIRLRQ